MKTSEAFSRICEMLPAGRRTLKLTVDSTYNPKQADAVGVSYTLIHQSGGVPVSYQADSLGGLVSKIKLATGGVGFNDQAKAKLEKADKEVDTTPKKK